MRIRKPKASYKSSLLCTACAAHLVTSPSRQGMLSSRVPHEFPVGRNAVKPGAPSSVVNNLLTLLSSNVPRQQGPYRALGTERPHPLDQLTAEEVQTAADCCNAHAGQQGLHNLRFNAVSLMVGQSAKLGQPSIGSLGT